MKKIILYAAAGLMLGTTSCKKGENDPFLSLSSRKGRISGEWMVSSSERNTTTTSGNDSWSTDQTFDGTTETTVDSYTTGGVTSSTTSKRTYTVYDWTINKDGTFSVSMSYTYTEVDEDTWMDQTTTTDYTVTIESSGSWAFVGKTKGEYKNKERVEFNHLSGDQDETESWTIVQTSSGNQIDSGTATNSWTYNYPHNVFVETYDIDQLKGKEMVWKRTLDGSNSNSWTSGNTTTTSTDVTTGAMSMTLTAK